MNFKEMAQANQILKIRVGSHLFGTSTPDSDRDHFAVFMPPDETIFGFQKCDEVDLSIIDKDDTGRNTKNAVDFKIHDYRKFVKLVAENNPNFIHSIFVNQENILEKDEHGFADRLLSLKDRIIHKGAYRKFVAYAHSQQHKMKIKPAKYAALESGVDLLDEFDDHAVLADVVNRSALNYDTPSRGKFPFDDSGKGKHVRCGDLSIERGVFVKKAKKMIRERLSKATSRAVLYSKFGYDVKFGSNLIHLLMEGRELMETGQLVFPLTYASQILDVKKGKYSAKEIDEWGDQLLEEARVAYECTDLPANPSPEIEQIMMREIYKWSQMTTKLSR